MNKGEKKYMRWRGIAFTVLVFLAMTLALVFALSYLEERNSQEQTKVLQDAVLRAVLTCYAVEGRYPQSVSYLKEHYGIVYDDEQYIVTLDAFASNLLPNIHVLSQGGTEIEQ